MRFQVPQFIDIEDKIFGPLTIKQFIYIAGGAGLSFILFRFLYLPIAIILIVAVICFSLAMAFYKINNKPLIYILQSAFGYFLSNKLYLWKKKDRTPEKVLQTSAETLEKAKIYVPKLSQSKLHDLTWSLDINESLNPVTKEEKN
jgi:cellulose synthase/poly-beta-1,6-N-acetylglucosamine synthase-like glycosyltransferase